MTDYKRGTYAAAGIIALLVALCALASLSGCLTPAKLTSMSQRADALSQGAKTKVCAEAAAKAECEEVAARCPDGSWVGWTYWHGGGKHGCPEEMPWVENAYAVCVTEEQKLVTVRSFSIGDK